MNQATIKVLIVDDSMVFRSTISKALEKEPSIEVTGTAPNGVQALKSIESRKPDIIVLDVEMPEMDGLETLRRVRERWPEIRVIMFSAHTKQGASTTLEALSLGAVDFLTKPTGASLSQSVQVVREELIPKIRAVAETTPRKSQPVFRPRPAPRPVQPRLLNRPALGEPPIVAVGVSTGGPNALGELLSRIPADFPSPIVITQHMPPLFTEQLARRLNALCPLEVCEGKNGMSVERGHVYIAPGDYHMEIVRNGARAEPSIRIHQGPKECSCRPSVDVMFRSVAESYGANTIAVILTGMGQDGLEGTKLLKGCDATVIVQDEATCVVYGMPKAIVENGLADKVVPVGQIAAELTNLVK